MTAKTSRENPQQNNTTAVQKAEYPAKLGLASHMPLFIEILCMRAFLIERARSKRNVATCLEHTREKKTQRAKTYIMTTWLQSMRKRRTPIISDSATGRPAKLQRKQKFQESEQQSHLL